MGECAKAMVETILLNGDSEADIGADMLENLVDDKGSPPASDSGGERSADVLEDPSEEDKGVPFAGATTLRLGWTCNAAATGFFTVLSAAVVTGIVFLFVLKASPSPEPAASQVQAAWTKDPEDHGDLTETSLEPAALLHQDARSLRLDAPERGNYSEAEDDGDGDGDDADDDDDDGFMFNETFIGNLRKSENFLMLSNDDNLEEVV
ncbi:hypothetical protein V5799_002843 [Amblyomma americanum]|uniref:Uncharacterized protein n=1 Tax=Amblyomma americanum TaxID=6943 RepID=A0AAQ4DAN3_AMBAM